MASSSNNVASEQQPRERCVPFGPNLFNLCHFLLPVKRLNAYVFEVSLAPQYIFDLKHRVQTVLSGGDESIASDALPFHPLVHLDQVQLESLVFIYKSNTPISDHDWANSGVRRVAIQNTRNHVYNNRIQNEIAAYRHLARVYTTLNLPYQHVPFVQLYVVDMNSRNGLPQGMLLQHVGYNLFQYNQEICPPARTAPHFYESRPRMYCDRPAFFEHALAQCTHALQFCHSAGIVHGDISSTNIMVVPKNHDGILYDTSPYSGPVNHETTAQLHKSLLDVPQLVFKLVDFGLCDFVSSSPQTVLHGACFGTLQRTPAFMAPEVLLNDKVHHDGFKADVFALGAALASLVVTGRFSLFTNGSMARALLEIGYFAGWKYLHPLHLPPSLASNALIFYRNQLTYEEVHQQEAWQNRDWARRFLIWLNRGIMCYACRSELIPALKKSPCYRDAHHRYSNDQFLKEDAEHDHLQMQWMQRAAIIDIGHSKSHSKTRSYAANGFGLHKPEARDCIGCVNKRLNLSIDDSSQKEDVTLEPSRLYELWMYAHVIRSEVHARVALNDAHIQTLANVIATNTKCHLDTMDDVAHGDNASMQIITQNGALIRACCCYDQTQMGHCFPQDTVLVPGHFWIFMDLWRELGSALVDNDKQFYELGAIPPWPVGGTLDECHTTVWRAKLTKWWQSLCQDVQKPDDALPPGIQGVTHSPLCQLFKDASLRVLNISNTIRGLCHPNPDERLGLHAFGALPTTNMGPLTAIIPSTTNTTSAASFQKMAQIFAFQLAPMMTAWLGETLADRVCARLLSRLLAEPAIHFRQALIYFKWWWISAWTLHVEHGGHTIVSFERNASLVFALCLYHAVMSLHQPSSYRGLYRDTPLDWYGVIVAIVTATHLILAKDHEELHDHLKVDLLAPRTDWYSTTQHLIIELPAFYKPAVANGHYAIKKSFIKPLPVVMAKDDVDSDDDALSASFEKHGQALIHFTSITDTTPLINIHSPNKQHLLSSPIIVSSSSSSDESTSGDDSSSSPPTPVSYPGIQWLKTLSELQPISTAAAAADNGLNHSRDSAIEPAYPLDDVLDTVEEAYGIVAEWLDNYARQSLHPYLTHPSLATVATTNYYAQLAHQFDFNLHAHEFTWSLQND